MAFNTTQHFNVAVTKIIHIPIVYYSSYLIELSKLEDILEQKFGRIPTKLSLTIVKMTILRMSINSFKPQPKKIVSCMTGKMNEKG